MIKNIEQPTALSVLDSLRANIGIEQDALRNILQRYVAGVLPVEEQETVFFRIRDFVLHQSNKLNGLPFRKKSADHDLVLAALKKCKPACEDVHEEYRTVRGNIDTVLNLIV